MDDQELDRRLALGDPARSNPASLDVVIDEVFAQPTTARRVRRKRVIIGVTAGVIVLGGALAAFTDLDTYLLSVPPFETLDEGTVRTAEGLSYIPVGPTDHGEQCKIWVDFGGLTPEQTTAVNSYWSHADPAEFAARVNARIQAFPASDATEGDAKQALLLDDFGRVVPGLTWGTPPPGHPWAAGEPHLTSFSTVCSDEMKASQ
ncbi:hypothetical protein [Leifsonia shinshuensis]